MTKLMELLLNETITGPEYTQIKKECEDKIVRAKAELKNLTDKVSQELDIEGMATLAASNLKNLSQFYAEADSDIKRSIIGSIFPEKWVFDGETHRTGNMNKAAQLIYYINKKLRHKKNGLKISENFQSGEVLFGTFLTNSFINDMKKIADIDQFQANL